MNKRSIFKSINEVPLNDWDHVSQDRNVYLTSAYLKALEESMNDTMDFYYTISYNSNDQAVLIAYYQVVTFEDKRRKYNEELCTIANHLSSLSKKIVESFNLNVLVCGNVFCDGENGFLWSSELAAEDAMNEIDIVTEELRRSKEVQSKASMTLFKEFWPQSIMHSDELKKKHYRDFMIDVNMVLKIHPEWNTMDDYLRSMKTKFRTRAKSVYKKSAELEIKSFDEAEIRAHETRITELFENVLEKSDFSYGTLKSSSFANFKVHLGDAFSFRGFFYQGELVGFSAGFFNKNSLEANFVGVDYELNTDYAIYQRILYDYVEQSLCRKVVDLQLGRTAELIKSAIGALPTNMKLYIKHRKSVPNLLLKPIVQSISPSEFELRKPFKANFTN